MPGKSSEGGFLPKVWPFGKSRLGLPLEALIIGSTMLPLVLASGYWLYLHWSIQVSQVKGNYIDRVDVAWQSLWRLPEYFRVAQTPLAHVLEDSNDALSNLPAALSGVARETKASFTVFVAPNNTLIAGASRYLQMSEATWNATSAPQPDFLNNKKILDGSPSQRELAALYEARYKGKKDQFPELIQPLDYVHYHESSIKIGCRLSDLPVLKVGVDASGFQAMPHSDLHCLGIERQMMRGVQVSDEGFVLLSVVPVRKKNKVIIGHLVTGILIDNLYPLGDFFTVSAGTANLTIFNRDKPVMTVMPDHNGKRLFNRRADPEAVKAILVDSWQLIKEIDLDGKHWFEGYLPLLDYKQRPVGIISVAKNDTLEKTLTEFNAITALQVGAIIVVVLIVGIPLRLIYIKQKEESGRLDREKAALLESLDVGALGLDEENKIVLANAKARSMLGHSELEGMSVGCILAVDSMDTIISELVCTQKSSLLENSYRVGAGTGHFISQSEKRMLCEYSILKTEEGTPNLRRILMFRDITNTSRLLNQLQAILDNSSSVIFLRDNAGRYIIVNTQFEALYGKSRTEILGKTDAEMFGKEKGQRALEIDTRVLDLSTGEQVEESVRGGGGGSEKVYLVNRFGLRDADGRAYAVCWIMTDITEQKEAEAQNTRMAILEERNSLAREFHDTFVATYTGIVLNLERATCSISGTPELERALLLANQGLSIARRSVRGLRHEVVDFKKLPQMLAAIGREKLAGAKINCSVQVSGRPCQISAEVGHNLLRISEEALTNVAKHSGAEKVDITLSYENCGLKLTIEDDGRGLMHKDGANGGFGLHIMPERALNIGARFEIGRGSSGGCKIGVTLEDASSSIDSSEACE